MDHRIGAENNAANGDSEVLELIRAAKQNNSKELNLSGQGLRTIPTQVFDLVQLEKLNLGGKRLTEVSEATTRPQNLSSMILRVNQLTEVPEAVTRLSNLTTLDLSSNQLTELPEAVTRLPKLTTLNLNQNQLTAMPDAITRLLNLTMLDLGLNKLTTISEAITRLPNLTTLNLGGNRLTTVPESITRLTNLKELDLNFNALATLPDAITRLTNLTMLDLGGSGLAAIPEVITRLTKLTMLDLGGNLLTTVPDSITRLTNLTELYLSGNQLTTLPESIARLTNLTELYLMGNQLTTIPDGISRLTNLRTLYLSFNGLTRVPESITQLTNLTTLDLRGNDLTRLPEDIADLTNLTTLELHGNQLTTVPEGITQLSNLTTLDLRGNRLREVSDSVALMPKLRILNLAGNPVETPPPEVAFKGVDAIRAYYRQLEKEGEDHLYEAKLLIVGEAGAGKTSLANKILDPNYALQPGEESTEGIQVLKWQFPIENGRNFYVNLWDFGGQEIYHATHQFFLTHRSLYVLVADMRNEDTDFYYWLNVVGLLSENSPLLIVKNEKQERTRELNERQLRAQYDGLKGILATNLATNRGLERVVLELKHHLLTLPHIGSPLPRTWVKVRERLEQEPRHHIPLEEFLQICQQNGFTLRGDKLQLSRFLHDLGVILHFQDDPLLNKTVILKPKWGTDAVYIALDNKELIRKRGRFTHAELARIWDAPEYTDMHDELLQLMVNFKLCYKIPDVEQYIAPQLLGENQPEYGWNAEENLTLKYTYEFMPKGIITQFIVVMHTWIENQELVWKTGVVLERDETRAEVVEYPGKRELRVRVAGARKKDLVTIVMYELDKIHAAYSQLKFDKLIPCRCTTCRAAGEPHYYKFEVLQRFLRDRQEAIQCQKSYEMVNVRQLVDDVIDGKVLLSESKAAGAPIIEHYYAGTVYQQSGGISITGGEVDVQGDMVGGQRSKP